MPTYYTGWRPEPFDPQDRPYVYLSYAEKPSLETFVDLSKDSPDCLNVYDQGPSETSVANAVAAAYRYLCLIDDDDKAVVEDPSRLFIYWNARYLANPSLATDNGCHIRNAMKGISLFGICSEKNWPFHVDSSRAEQIPNFKLKINERPRPEAWKEADEAHGLQYARLDADHPEQIEAQMSEEEKIAVGVLTLTKLRQCLSEGYPVVFGFKFFWKHPPFVRDGTDADSEWFLPRIPEHQRHKGPSRNYGGHAALAIGYDDDKQCVLCQNSWGKNANDAGVPRFWMDYSWIRDWEATDDFWMIRHVETSSKPISKPLPPLYSPHADAPLTSVETTFVRDKANHNTFRNYYFHPPVGGMLGSYFNDVQFLKDEIHGRPWPRQLRFIYKNHKGRKVIGEFDVMFEKFDISHGSREGQSDETSLHLAAGDYIRNIKIQKSREHNLSGITYVEIKTKMGITGCFGAKDDRDILVEYECPPGFTGLQGLWGHEGDILDRFGPIWAR